jgi:hypothetical protein
LRQALCSAAHPSPFSPRSAQPLLLRGRREEPHEEPRVPERVQPVRGLLQEHQDRKDARVSRSRVVNLVLRDTHTHAHAHTHTHTRTRTHTHRFDVLLTNPPYSTKPFDHIERLMAFCASQGKPYFILQPCYVYTKDYYKRAVQAPAQPFYVTPSRRSASPPSFVFSPRDFFFFFLCFFPCLCVSACARAQHSRARGQCGFYNRRRSALFRNWKIDGIEVEGREAGLDPASTYMKYTVP